MNWGRFIRCDAAYLLIHAGGIIEFMVQYEVKIGGEWYPVVRYDTAHGFAHQDVLHWRGPAERRELPGGDYNLALSYAEEDLRRNWESYRARFLREVKPE